MSQDPSARADRRARPLVALVAALSLALLAGGTVTTAPVAADGAGASTAETKSGAKVRVLERGSRGRYVVALQRRLRITADGVFGRGTERAVRRFQRRRGLVVDGVVGPQTARALRIRLPRARSQSGGGSGLSGATASERRTLHKIAMCESGGNPRAVSPDGRYRGKYQFSRDTWAGLGGSGDPARARESTQDRMALKLLRRAGTSPWPNCA